VQSSEQTDVKNPWIVGRLAGELEQNVIQPSACDIPVAMIAGDDKIICTGRNP
jgi:D-aminopeptidase